MPPIRHVRSAVATPGLVARRSAAMTAWLSSGEVPSGFTIDQDTELQSPVEEKATVRFVRHTLDPKELQRHIAAGKQCTRLALTWASRVSFVLTESLTI